MLVAKNLIPRGRRDHHAKKELFQVASLPKDDLKVGAISDPAYLNGRVAAGDIFPGQQITTADLSVQTTEACHDLTGASAGSLPIDASRGLVGYMAQGDHVDVYVGLTDGKDAPDAPRAGRRDPPRARGGPSTTYVLKAAAPLAQKLAYASDAELSGSCCDRRSAPRRHRR